MRRLYIIILCLCCCLEDYNVGRLEQAEQQLKSHIKEFPVTLQLSAYRLLSLCYIGMDREEDAVSYVRLMLAENPYYSPTISDPQRFIDMVEDIKSGLSAVTCRNCWRPMSRACISLTVTTISTLPCVASTVQDRRRYSSCSTDTV